METKRTETYYYRGEQVKMLKDIGGNIGGRVEYKGKFYKVHVAATEQEWDSQLNYLCVTEGEFERNEKLIAYIINAVEQEPTPEFGGGSSECSKDEWKENWKTMSVPRRIRCMALDEWATRGYESQGEGEDGNEDVTYIMFDGLDKEGDQIMIPYYFLAVVHDMYFGNHGTFLSWQEGGRDVETEDMSMYLEAVLRMVGNEGLKKMNLRAHTPEKVMGDKEDALFTTSIALSG